MSTQELWDQGTPISMAGLKFASPDMQRRYMRPRLHRNRPLGGGWRLLVSSMQLNGQDTSQFEQHAIKFQKIMERSQRRSHVWGEIQENLLEGLKHGELTAVGYVKSSDVDSKPIVIPARFFERRFLKLEKDSILTDQHEFRFVRVVAAPQRYKKDKMAKRGRPAMNTDIIEAMIFLNNREGTPFNNGPKKTHVGAIQRRIKQVNPHARVPSERTVLKMIPVGLEAISKHSDR